MSRRRSPGPSGRHGRAGSPRARLFVALDLPGDARRSIAEWRDRAIAGRDDLRPVPPEALHVTLCFLGWRPEKEVAQIAAATSDACTGVRAPRLAASGLEPVPRRRPRLFALDLVDEDGRASSLQAAVAGALADARVFEPDRRPFWPHVTLARVKRGARSEQLLAPAPPPDVFKAACVTLYRSTLRPQGALYEPLAQVRLGG